MPFNKKILFHINETGLIYLLKAVHLCVCN